MSAMTGEAGFSAMGEAKWLHVIAVAAFLAASAPNVPLLAQGLDSDEAIDAIVGSDVNTEEGGAEAETDRIVDAIGATRENSERVRKAFNLNELRIVFLPDLDEKGSDIAAAISEHENEIADLRAAIEGSAIFYHAVDSRTIAVSNIVALEFQDNDNATIFVAGEDPNR